MMCACQSYIPDFSILNITKQPHEFFELVIGKIDDLITIAIIGTSKWILAGSNRDKSAKITNIFRWGCINIIDLDIMFIEIVFISHRHKVIKVGNGVWITRASVARCKRGNTKNRRNLPVSKKGNGNRVLVTNDVTLPAHK